MRYIIKWEACNISEGIPPTKRPLSVANTDGQVSLKEIGCEDTDCLKLTEGRFPVMYCCEDCNNTLVKLSSKNFFISELNIVCFELHKHLIVWNRDDAYRNVCVT